MGWNDSRFSVRDWGGTITRKPQPVLVVPAKVMKLKTEKFQAREWRL